MPNFKQKLLQKIKTELNQGISTRKKALAISFGTILGIIPFFGINMFLCIVLTRICRMNQISIQPINTIVYI